jgi:hypothetical protein
VAFTIDSDYAGYTVAATDYVGPVPATIAEGDLILAQIAIAYSSALVSPAPPDGSWTALVADAQTGSAVEYSWWWHLVTASEASSPPESWTFTLSDARTGNIIITRITGHLVGDPFNTSVSTTAGSYSNSSPLTLTAVTTTVADCLLVGGASINSASSRTITIPSGWTQDDTTCTLGYGKGQTAAHYQLGAAGSTGDIDWYQSGTSLSGAGFMIAVAPASSADAALTSAVTSGITVEAAATSPAAASSAVTAGTSMAGAATSPAAVSSAVTAGTSMAAELIVEMSSAVTAGTSMAGAATSPAAVSSVVTAGTVLAVAATSPAAASSAVTAGTAMTAELVTTIASPVTAGTTLTAVTRADLTSDTTAGTAMTAVLTTPPYSYLTIGRLTLTEDWTVNQKAGSSGRTMSLRMSEASTIGGSQRAVRELGEGMLAMRGQTVPVAGLAMDHHAGWWTIDSVTVQELTWWDTTVIEWTVDLTRVGRNSEVEVESRLVGGDRTTVATSATAERWHAPATGGDAYYVGASTPTYVDRVGEGGTVRVYRSIPAATSPRWGIASTAYLVGAAVLTVDGYVRAGMTCEDTPDDWSVSNGLVKVEPSTSAGTLTVTSYLTSGWGTAKVFDFKRGSTSLGAASHVTVVRNDACEAILRLTWDHAPGRTVCDIAVKRGARHVSLHLQQHIASSALRVDDNAGGGTVDDQLATYGYILRTDADADGNRWLIGSPLACDAAGTFGLAAHTAALSLPAFIGVERAGSSAVAGDTAAAVNSQYLGTPAETEQVIAR